MCGMQCPTVMVNGCCWAMFLSCCVFIVIQTCSAVRRTLQCWQPPHAYDYIISSCILFLLDLCRLLRELVGVAAFSALPRQNSPKAPCLLLTCAPLFHPLEGQTLGLPLSRVAGPLYTTEAICSLPAPSLYLFGVFSFQPPPL